MSNGGKINLKKLAAAVVLVGVIAASSIMLVYLYFIYPEASMGYEQPISFSHRLHNTDKKIDCYYCHSYAHRSINPGLPSVQKCLGCHRYVIPDHPEIQKLRNYEARGENIPWIKAYYAPDHVFFPHYRHIKRQIECQKCHGEVQQMDRLPKRTYYMGFCITCHDQYKATRECTACHQ